jgi:hypothetical protein
VLTLSIVDHQAFEPQGGLFSAILAAFLTRTEIRKGCNEDLPSMGSNTPFKLHVHDRIRPDLGPVSTRIYLAWVLSVAVSPYDQTSSRPAKLMGGITRVS